MIRVLNTKYKSIGNILLIPASDETPFYVKAPIDFLLDCKEGLYNLVLRYTNYNDTFEYLSCKLLATLETMDSRVAVLYIHNYITPDPDAQSSHAGYPLSYKISYNNYNKTDLFMSFISEPILCP